MKAIALAISAVLLGWTGLALAGPAGDESAFTLHLEAANQNSIYLKCQYGKDITHCPNPTLWEETNSLRGLQTGGSAGDLATVGPDAQLLS